MDLSATVGSLIKGKSARGKLAAASPATRAARWRSDGCKVAPNFTQEVLLDKYICDKSSLGSRQPERLLQGD